MKQELLDTLYSKAKWFAVNQIKTVNFKVDPSLDKCVQFFCIQSCLVFCLPNILVFHTFNKASCKEVVTLTKTVVCYNIKL